jgi:hypothetical protein
MWPERTDARVGVHRDGIQLPHSHWGPEVEQSKWCRPSETAVVVFAISLALRTCGWAMDVMPF